MGYKEFYDSKPMLVNIGLLTGTSAVAIQLPDIPCTTANLKARSNNIGSFFVGETASDLYWELDANNETGFVPLNNLSQLYAYNPSGSSEGLMYWVFA